MINSLKTYIVLSVLFLFFVVIGAGLPEIILFVIFIAWQWSGRNIPYSKIVTGIYGVGLVASIVVFICIGKIFPALYLSIPVFYILAALIIGGIHRQRNAK